MVAKLSACIRAVCLYSRSHPVTVSALEEAQEAVKVLLGDSDRIDILITDGYLLLDKFPVEDRSGVVAGFADELRRNGVAALSISAGLTQQEIAVFAEALRRRPGDHQTDGKPSAELQRLNVGHIRVQTGIMRPTRPKSRDAAGVYENALDSLGATMSSARAKGGVSGVGVAATVCQMLDAVMHDQDALLALTAIRSYDNYLLEHSVNVCIISMLFALDLGLDQDGVLDLGMCGMLHDIGKVFLPEEIIRKPGKLSEEEWEQIRRHPAQGARVLAGASDLPALAATIAYEHHMRSDASGYPAAPDDHTQHFLSRVVSIVDVYDALTADRPYRQKWTPQEAMAWMLYESPERFDERLLARFASRAGLHAVGSLVRLKNGCCGVVVGGSYTSPTKPQVMIVSEPENMHAERRMVNLSEINDHSFEIEQVAQPVEALFPCTKALLAV